LNAIKGGEIKMEKKTEKAQAVAFGLPVNTASALAYVLGWVSGWYFCWQRRVTRR